MVFNWLREKTSALQSEVKKYRNKELLEAIVAGCAFVAYANGSVSSEEKQKMNGFIKRSEALNVFDTSTVIEVFNQFLGHFEFDAAIGEGEVLKTVAKLKGKPEAQLMVQVCIAIGASDGDFDASERAVVKKLCGVLDLDPAQFEL